MSLPTVPPGYLIGIDTSPAQGHLAASHLVGVDFVICKASDGYRDGRPTSTWAQHAETVLTAKKLLGAYGVIEPYGADHAADQANHFCDVVQGSGACLVALDFELGKGRPASDLLRAARIWLDTVEARLSKRALVYTYPAFWNTLVKWAGAAGAEDVAAIATRPLWLAWYGDGHHVIDPMSERPEHVEHGVTVTSVPGEWPSGEAIWQTGPHGATLPGTSIAVDVNWFEGTVDDLRGLAALTPLTVPGLG